MSAGSIISRRSALKRLSGAAAAVGVLGGPWPARAQERQRSSINQAVVAWPFGDVGLERLAQAAQEMSLHGIDYLAPEDWPVLEEYGLVCTTAQGPDVENDDWIRLAHHEQLVPAYRQRIRETADVGYSNIIAFSGNRDGMTDEEGLENAAAGLKQIMSAAENRGVTIVIEFLNSKVDHPGYMFDNMQWGVDLVDAVGSDNLKILYDIYHAQIMEGDVIRTIRDYSDYIGHYHTAGVPGRNEIDETQELYYPAIMRAIAETGFDGYVAHEFRPTRDPLTSLQQAVDICEV